MKKIILSLFMLLAILAFGGCEDEVASVDANVANSKSVSESIELESSEDASDVDDEADEESLPACCLPDNDVTAAEE